MNKDEKYFVSLLASYLNCSRPPVSDNVDWDAVYTLASINNVSAIIANQARLLDKNKPDEKIMSALTQQLGYTLIDSAEKESAVSELENILGSADIDYIFVKGQIIKNYYPIPELRTSADTDVIIHSEDISAVKSLLADYQLKDAGPEGFCAVINNQNIEFHSENDYDNEYFRDIFSMSSNHRLDDYSHLFYVLCHIVKHLRYLGAGIKMFMDVDALVRSINDFDYDKALLLSRKIGIEAFFKASMSLCAHHFDTPVKAELDYLDNQELFTLFENEIINGGSFGLSKRELADHYNISGNREGTNSKFKTLFAYAFPDKDYLKRYYKYARRYPVLLPVAAANRLVDGVIRHRKNTSDTLKSILKPNENEDYIRLLRELDI